MQTQDPTHPTGVADTGERPSGNALRARQRKAHAALDLKKAGATWAEIAEVLGFPTGDAAHVAVERVLEEDLKNPESQEFLRHIASQRLDRLLRSVWGKAINEKDPDHLLANTKARELIRDYRQLHGLDAPTQMVVSSPSAIELEKWVATVQRSSQPQLEEADIFDVEVLEDSGAASSE